ncbi:RND family transporter [Thalassolituus sp.]|uniref:efflux RND transporter permease subunit n=1 Tax=Thalassolituus sp. TaxID=2030822 RepID=UPI003519C3E5
MLERYLSFIQRHPILILALTAVALFTSAAGTLNLTFTSDFRKYFSDQNPQLNAFEAMETRFSRQDNLYFLVTAPEDSLFTPVGLTLTERLTQEGWTLPYVQRVDSLQNYQYTQVDGDELLIDDFFRSGELPDDLSELQNTALADADILLKLLSPDARVTGINLMLNLPGENSSEASKEAVAAARALLDRIRPDYPDYLIELGGSATSNVTMGEAIQQDIESLLMLSYLVMLIIMLVLLRTISGVILISALIGMSVLITMGIFGWAGYTLTPPTGFVPTAIMTIAVADTIHILVTYYFHLRQGDSREASLRASMKLNFSPVFITSITTMVGVLALNTSDSPPYRDMGNMIALGVMVAWALTITFLPAILQLLPAPAQHRDKGTHRWPDRLADTVIRHHKPMFIAMLLVVAGCASLAPRNDITESWHEFFDESFEVRRTVDHIEESLQGLHVLYFVADSGKADGINEPAYLQQLDDFAEWLRSQPEVVHVSALSDTLKRLNQDLHGDDPQWYRIPATADAAAQYLLLYELSLPLGLGLDTTMTSDRSATRLSASLHRTDSATILTLERKATDWAATHAPLLMINETTGLDVVFANLTHRNVVAMMEGTGAALIIISLLMIAALRSWPMGLISMVPNVLPALMAYGLWGVLYGHIDTATSVVACLSLGIVVDDTVHFLSKYNYARLTLRKSVEDAIRYAFHTVGVALMITSAILVGGFTVMEFSHFNPSRAMGLLLALTIAVALVIDFLLLPPLLMLTDRRTLSTEQTAVTDTVEDKLNRQRTE